MSQPQPDGADNLEQTPEKSSEVKTEQADSRAPARWVRQQSSAIGRRRLAVVAATCLTTALIGVLWSLLELPRRQPATQLVHLYLVPPPGTTVGVDAPHESAPQGLFGLVPKNVRNWSHVEHDKPTASPDQADPKKDAKPSGAGTASIKVAAEPAEDPTGEESVPDWRPAIRSVSHRDQLVMHVSCLARMEHQQVVFYGREPDSQHEVRIVLSELLRPLAECSAASKLLVLEVHWPLRQEADASDRLQALNQIIRQRVAELESRNLHVLLSSDGQTPCRGETNGFASLLDSAFRAGLVDHQADQDGDGQITLPELVGWAAPRIASAGSQASLRSASVPAAESGGSSSSPGQRIVWIPARDKTRFVIPADVRGPAPRTSTPKSEYPTWLVARHRELEATCEDLSLILPADALRQYRLRLASFESRWRCGEQQGRLREESDQAASDWHRAVRAETLQRHKQRPDSLAIAGQIADPKIRNQIADATKTLVADVREIRETMPAKKRDAAIEQRIQAWLAQQEANQDAALAMLVQDVLQATSIRASDLQFLATVQGCFAESPHFSICQAIERLVETPLEDRRQRDLLRLIHWQDQLGRQPMVAGWLNKPLTKVLTEVVEAQQLTFAIGLTTSRQIERSIQLAETDAQRLASLEGALQAALRQVECIALQLELDEALSRDAERSMVTHLVSQDVRASLQAIDAVRQQLGSDDRLSAEKLARVRQTSAALKRHWKAAIEQIVLQATDREQLPVAGYSVAIPAEVRAALYAPLKSADSRGFPARRSNSVRAVVARGRAPAGDTSQRTAPTLSPAKVRERIERWSTESKSGDEAWRAAFVRVASRSGVLPIYQKLALRADAGAVDDAIAVSMEGAFADLSWNRPEATMELHNRVDLPDKPAVRFEFLPPAADIFERPSWSGALMPGQRLQLAFRLVDQARGAAVPDQVRGLWLRLSQGERTELVPLRCKPLASRPPVTVDFGGRTVIEGNRITLPRWPDRNAHDVDWTVTNNQGEPLQLVARVTGAHGNRLEAPPIAVPAGKTRPLRFPAAEANAKEGPPAGLVAPLQLRLERPSGEDIGDWHVDVNLIDPGSVLSPREAVFQQQADGSNRLRLVIQADRPVDEASLLPIDSPPAGGAVIPTVQLKLTAATLPMLEGIASGQLDRQLTQLDQPATLHAEGLRLGETRAGSESVWPIPLVVNGDPGYFTLLGRFPRAPGVTKPTWDRQPRLELQSRDAALPGTEMPVVIRARQLPDDGSLTLICRGGQTADGPILWQRKLPTSRRIEASFVPGGKASTWSLTAARYDWQVAVPVPNNHGLHRIEVRGALPESAGRIEASQTFMIDDQVPDQWSLRGEQTDSQTTIWFRCRPGPSGLESVTAKPDIPAAPPVKEPLTFSPADSSGAVWSARWPQGWPPAKQAKMTLQTGAGKIAERSMPIAVTKIEPQGQLSGIVTEGSVPQPDLVVLVRDPKKKAPRRLKTGSDGRFQVPLPPGKYALSATKPSTGRKAQATVRIQDGQQQRVELSLMRSN